MAPPAAQHRFTGHHQYPLPLSGADTLTTLRSSTLVPNTTRSPDAVNAGCKINPHPIRQSHGDHGGDLLRPGVLEGEAGHDLSFGAQAEEGGNFCGW